MGRINEVTRISREQMTSKIGQRYWALYAAFYEKIFQRLDSVSDLRDAYKARMNSGELTGEAKDAMTFFYRIRRDEIENPEFWNNQNENMRNIRNMINMVAESLSESLNESLSRYCAIYKASDEQWYLELADREHGEYEDATVYGPFGSEERANRYLDYNFSNPGGLDVDDSGEQEPPTSSPDGSPVKRPNRGRGATPGGYRSFGGFR